MGFLNKNAVAARQLPVLAHQRIFAVSAYLHGIMDTAQNGRVSDYTGCVPAFAHRQTPVLGGRIATAQNGRVSDYSGCVPAFAHRQTPILGGCIAAAQNGTTGLPVRWIKPVIFSREAPGAWFPSFLKADSAGFHTGMPRLPSPPDKASATGGQHHGNGIPLL